MLTVCLIEDDRITRKLFIMLLEKAGFTVQDFDNGASALDWLGANSADVVLSNIVLPEGVSGTDILHHIRTTPKVPQTLIFALTSFVRRGERERYLEMGFDGCVAKPIDPQTFAEDLRLMIVARQN